MKKIYLFFLTLALILGLCSCANVPPPAPPVSQAPVVSDPVSPETSEPESTPPAVEPPPTFAAPADTVVCGVDLSGMTRDEALTALTDALGSYTHSLLIGETEVSISGQAVSLTPDSASFEAFWKALETDKSLPELLISLDRTALEQILSSELEYPAKNASVAYSKNQGEFVIISGSNGMDYDIPSIADFVAPCMCSLYASSSMNGFGRETAPSVSDDDPRVTAAVEKANDYLNLTLVYTFTTENGGTISETFLRDTVAPMIQIGSDYSVSINRSIVERQVTAVAARHSGLTSIDYFVATDGRSIPYAVTYYGRQVDVEAMTEDLYSCLINGISGQRIAPYLSSEQTALPYGGSYVEIDLTAQTLWVYKNGQCVVTTPIVSGCVAEGNNTPTGVFSIYRKSEDAWLAGPTWYDHVDYWMPFYGAYGLHDASWRSEFGGEIYIHKGSHGCPNLPVEITGQIYHNVSVGTPVIIYGGLSTAVDLKQEITGTAVYDLTESSQSFPLDLSLKYPEAEITYTSDNTEVATVSADGIVTIHGEGVANITVSAAAFTYHTAAEMTVQITVAFPEEPKSHLFGEWSQSTAPGCETAGSESRTCSLCGFVETQEIPATDHDFSVGSFTCANGCGTVNPNTFFPDW